MGKQGHWDVERNLAIDRLRLGRLKSFSQLHGLQYQTLHCYVTQKSRIWLSCFPVAWSSHLQPRLGLFFVAFHEFSRALARCSCSYCQLQRFPFSLGHVMLRTQQFSKAGSRSGPKFKTLQLLKADHCASLWTNLIPLNITCMQITSCHAIPLLLKWMGK